jgi:hypothetical protein
MKIIITVERTANMTPCRDWDYMATIQDQEETETSNALGSTKELAVLNLLEQILNRGHI